MNITIGDYNSNTGFVSVTFEYNNITHTRDVRAVVDNDGYNSSLTSQRIDEVALGVRVKIDNGIVINDGEGNA